MYAVCPAGTRAEDRYEIRRQNGRPCVRHTHGPLPPAERVTCAPAFACLSSRACSVSVLSFASSPVMVSRRVNNDCRSRARCPWLMFARSVGLPQDIRGMMASSSQIRGGVMLPANRGVLFRVRGGRHHWLLQSQRSSGPAVVN